MQLDFLPRYLILLLFAMLSIDSAAQPGTQELDSQTLPLSDLSSFQNPNTVNWKIAGNVSVNRHQAGSLKASAGTGVLIFTPSVKPPALVSKLEFGDLDLDLDFLLTRHAAFTITLHNQCKINISDTWLKPGFDAFKSAGLWQNLRIHFKGSGLPKQIEKVILNGQDITATAGLTSSVSSTSININFAIEGKKGGFAIRNILYRTYQPDRILLSEISYKVYNGLHKNPDTLALLPVKRQGNTDTLSHRVGDRKSQLVFDGTIEIPSAGEYLFKLTAGGGAWLYIDNKKVITNNGSRDFERAFYQKTNLKKGKYPFKIVYMNSDECLVLHYQGPHIPWQSLTTPASVRLSEQFEPLEYEVKNRPALQRGFMIHAGKVNPYTAAVGFGTNNYAYDMHTYNILAGWHGKFIDVANMWRERGEKQLEIPLGAKLEFSGKPLLAQLNEINSTWPDSAQTQDGVFNSRGYNLDVDQNPVFSYALQNVKVEDRITQIKTHEGLSREIKIQNESKRKQFYILLAEGKYIEKLSDGSYAVDDKSYFIEKLTVSGASVSIRKGKDVQQLIVPVSASTPIQTIKYNLIW